jgi:hypothetical protein
MPKNRPVVAHAVVRLRFRSIVTTMLLIALSFMIVRDIIMRRWGSPRRLPPT